MPGAPRDVDLAKTASNATVGKPTTDYLWLGNYNNANSAVEYPLLPFQKDPYDEVAQQKMMMGQVAAGPNWVVPFTEQDAAYNERKRIQDEQVKFDAWLMQKYDLTDPAQNMMLQQIAPSLYDRREELINNLQNLVTRYAQIRLRGAKSEDDLRFQWLIDTGRLELPQGPIWDPKKWRDAQGLFRAPDDGAGNAWNFAGGNAPFTRQNVDRRANQLTYEKGFFNFAKWISPATAGKVADPYNYFNIAGTDVRMTYPLQYMRANASAGMTNAYSANAANRNQPGGLFYGNIAEPAAAALALAQGNVQQGPMIFAP